MSLQYRGQKFLHRTAFRADSQRELGLQQLECTNFRPPSSPPNLPIGASVVPFYGLYLESCKVNPKKALLRGLGVVIQTLRPLRSIGASCRHACTFLDPWGLGFRVWGLGFRGLGFRVWGLGFGVKGLGFRGLGFRV